MLFYKGREQRDDGLNKRDPGDILYLEKGKKKEDNANLRQAVILAVGTAILFWE